MAIPRVKTGLKELDEILHGGIPERNSVIILGEVGTGKTTLTMQVLHNAAKRKKRSLFVSLEENPKDIIEQAESYGWQIQKNVDDNFIIFQHHIDLDYESLEISIENFLRKYKDIKFVVIDPISMLNIYFKSETGFRVALFRLFQLFKKYNVTAFLIDDNTNSFAGQYVSDGVVVLKIEKVSSQRIRTLEIAKMRKTSHELGPIHFKIINTGIELYPHEKI